ncbi:MAG: hypothetical protein MJY61_01810 [Bacteroidales bacterium]|nr:hypothetical protein [Bacteroidales bacterium]
MKVRNVIFCLNVAVICLVPLACTRNNPDVPEPDPGEKIVIPEYTIVESEFIDPDTFVSLLDNPLAEIIPVDFFQEEYSATMQALSSRIQSFKDNGVNIKRVIFSYYTTDKSGKKIHMSVRLDYPVGGNGEVLINSCTLFNHIFVPTNSYCPTNFFCINELRVFHGAMVVVPDFQGYGLSTGSPNNSIAPLVDGMQSTEALLIAKDIVKKDRHAQISSAFHTDNIGISRGALAALGFQRYLESLSDEAVQKEINLSGTFYAEVSPYLISKFSRMSLSGLFLNKTAFAITVMSALYNYPEALEPLQVSDFFTDEFNNRKVTVGGSTQSMITALLYQDWSLLECIAAWGGISNGHGYDILNRELCDEDGNLNEDSEQYKALQRIDSQSDLVSGWSPRHPITLAFCPTDDISSPEDVEKMYTELSFNSKEEVNLLWYEIDSDFKGVSDHAMSSFHWEFHTVRQANPLEVE